MYHKTCYTKRRSLNRYDEESESSDFSSVKKTRRSYQVNFDRTLCVFCQKNTRTKGNNTRTKGNLVNFATDKAINKVKDCLKTSLNNVIKDRLRDVDLVAAEVKYHKTCYLEFIREANTTSKGEQIPTYELDNLDLTYNHFEERINRGKVIGSTEFVDHYQLLDPGKRAFNILRSLVTRYKDKVALLDINLSQKIILRKDLSILDMLNSEPDDMKTLKSAAWILARDIKAKWKPIKTYDIDNELVQSLIPETLTFFLESLDSNYL